MTKDWLIPTKVFNRITLNRVKEIEELVRCGEEDWAMDKLRDLRNSLEARVKVVPMRMEEG